jgi:hypothetical protein
MPIVIHAWPWLAAGFSAGAAVVLLITAVFHDRKHRHLFEAVMAQPRGGNVFFPSAETVIVWRCANPKCPEPISGLVTTVIDGHVKIDDVRGDGGVPTVPNNFAEV